MLVLDDAVTIDLNGFSILKGGKSRPKRAGTSYVPGSGSKGFGGDIGISSTAFSPVTILNGKIIGFDAGILLEGLGNQVEMVTTIGNLTGIIIDLLGLKGFAGNQPNGGLIENCELTENLFGLFGICVVVRDSNVSSNLVGGLDCWNCTISNNHVSKNGDIGFVASTSLITGNTIISGGGFFTGALELDDYSGWSNHVIQDPDVGPLTPAKGGLGPQTFPGIGGWLIDCNLVNTLRFCWDDHFQFF